jgi:hypothetical protein
VDLAAAVDLEGAVRDLDDLDATHRLDGRYHLAAVLDARALDRYLAHGALAAGVDGVDRDDRAVQSRDGGRDLAEEATRPVRERDAQG